MLAAASVCCKPKEIDLTGTWTQPVPGQAGGWSQGMQLNADGTASSVNMYTLVLESWKREGDKLILTGKSVGNGINIAFTDTLTIDRKSTDDSLFLRQGTNVQAFGRLRRTNMNAVRLSRTDVFCIHRLRPFATHPDNIQSIRRPRRNPTSFQYGQITCTHDTVQRRCR